MPKSTRHITFIGYGLSLLYGLTFLSYFKALVITPFRLHAIVLLIILGALAIMSIAVTLLKEWARQGLVILNGLLAAYFIFLLLNYSEFVHWSYILLGIVTVLYFNQKSLRIICAPEKQFARKSILIVDDDEGIVKTVQKILLPNGYSVLSAATGEKGMQVAKLQKPDLIILDVILPGMKGREVCARMKDDPDIKPIPVVFLTSKNSEDDIQAELAAGGVSHITKPVDARKLLAEVKKILS